MDTNTNLLVNITSGFWKSEQSSIPFREGSTPSNLATKNLQATLVGDVLNELRNQYRAFVLPFVIIIGCLGNVVILAVCILHTAAVAHSTRFYYIILAISDVISLLSYHLDQFLSKGIETLSNGKLRIDTDTGSDFLCGGNRYVFYLSETLGNYFYLLFTIERIFAIRFPFTLQKYFSREKTILIILILVIFHGFAYLILFWTFGLVKEGKLVRCITSNDRLVRNAIYEAFIVPNSHFIPIIANSIFNVILINYIRTAIDKRTELMEQATVTEQQKAKELSITNTIAVVQIIHFVNYFPSGFLWLIRAIMEVTYLDESTPDTYEAFYNGSRLTLSLTSIGHGVNIFIYIVKIPTFRKFISLHIS